MSFHTFLPDISETASCHTSQDKRCNDSTNGDGELKSVSPDHSFKPSQRSVEDADTAYYRCYVVYIKTGC